MTRNMRRRVEHDDTEEREAAEAKRKQHQKELWEKMKEEALERLNISNRQKTKEKKGEKDDEEESVISYSKPQALPRDLPRNRIYIDSTSDSIVLPIYGNLVPFHISMVKNVTSPDDSQEIRISFIAPAVGPAHISVNQQHPTITANPDKVFLREVSYKLGNEKNLTGTLRQIQELRKRWNQKQSMKKKTESIVTQEKLILSTSRDYPRLSNVLIRPTLGGRRTAGTLEVHKNGFRFAGGRGQTLDIMFKNIKYAFFQKCKGTLITLLHFHLVNAIMVGKKKATDIQFFVEVVEAVRDVEKDRRSAFDQDELEEEQRERALRKKWNDTFLKFVQSVDNVVDGLEFDIPFDDLAFNGCVDRNTVSIVPTVHCLVHYWSLHSSF